MNDTTLPPHPFPAPVRCDFSTAGDGFDIPVRTFYFLVTVPPEEEGQKRLAHFVDSYLHDKVLADVEQEFGMHDILGEDGELAGFSSYSVEDQQMKQAMQTWSRAFTQAGFQVSPTKETTPDAYARDVLDTQDPAMAARINDISNGLPDTGAAEPGDTSRRLPTP